MGIDKKKRPDAKYTKERNIFKKRQKMTKEKYNCHYL